MHNLSPGLLALYQALQFPSNSSIAIIYETRPEIMVLAGGERGLKKAGITPEGDIDSSRASISIRIFGESHPEFDRLAVAILTYARLLDGTTESWRAITCSQKSEAALSWETYCVINKILLDNLSDDEKREDLLTAIVISNAAKGKIDAWECLVASIGEDQRSEYILSLQSIKSNWLQTEVDPQFAMYQALANGLLQVPSVNYQSKYQKQFIDGLGSRFSLIQANQGEAPATAARTFSALPESTKIFFNLHSLMDLAGAAGHISDHGSITLTEDVARNFLIGFRSCCYQEAAQIYEHMILERGVQLGFGPDSEDFNALTRIAMLCRYPASIDPHKSREEGLLVKEAFENLPEVIRQSLKKELDETGLEQKPAIMLYFSPAIMQNLLKAWSYHREGKLLAIQEALFVTDRLYKYARKIFKDVEPDQNNLHILKVDQVAKECKACLAFQNLEIRHVMAGSHAMVEIKNSNTLASDQIIRPASQYSSQHRGLSSFQYATALLRKQLAAVAVENNLKVDEALRESHKEQMKGCLNILDEQFSILEHRVAMLCRAVYPDYDVSDLSLRENIGRYLINVGYPIKHSNKELSQIESAAAHFGYLKSVIENLIDGVVIPPEYQNEIQLVNEILLALEKSIFTSDMYKRDASQNVVPKIKVAPVLFPTLTECRDLLEMTRYGVYFTGDPRIRDNGLFSRSIDSKYLQNLIERGAEITHCRSNSGKLLGFAVHVNPKHLGTFKLDAVQRYSNYGRVGFVFYIAVSATAGGQIYDSLYDSIIMQTNADLLFGYVHSQNLRALAVHHAEMKTNLYIEDKIIREGPAHEAEFSVFRPERETLSYSLLIPVSNKWKREFSRHNQSIGGSLKEAELMITEELPGLSNPSLTRILKNYDHVNRLCRYYEIALKLINWAENGGIDNLSKGRAAVFQEFLDVELTVSRALLTVIPIKEMLDRTDDLEHQTKLLKQLVSEKSKYARRSLQAAHSLDKCRERLESIRSRSSFLEFICSDL